jgi:cytochrome b6-f complex iron-sulfur subunit
MTDDEAQNGFSRRRILVAGGGTALGATTLVACGSDSGAESRSSPAAGSGSGGPGSVLAKVSDVPVGGAISAEDSDGKPVIVSRPTAGEVVAFSAICTHRGCTVAPKDRILQCPCHGSTYDPATGANTGGPAPSPLAKVSVIVRRGEVVEA